MIRVGNETVDSARSRWREWRRRLALMTPVIVWTAAVIAAVVVHRRVYFAGAIRGFADDQPVTLAHFEPGTVHEVHVRLFDSVARGQVLLTLDDAQERIELQSIETDVERLRAAVGAEKARLEASNAWSTADVSDLARQFAVDREEAHVEYLAQQVTNATDAVLLGGAEVEYEHERRLYDSGSAAFLELVDAETKVGALRETVSRNAEVLASKKQAFDEADLRWNAFLARQDVTALYDPVLTPLRLAVEVRRHDLDETVRRINAHVLRAPTDGQVTILLARAGDSVQVGTPLVAISPTSTNRVLAYLPEDIVHSTHIGSPVAVRRFTADPAEFKGRVVGLSAVVSEAPLRFRTIPGSPVWGRGLLVNLDEGVQLLPGEAVRIAFLAN